MSHPDPLFDPENAYEDDDMMIEDEYEYREEDREHIDNECLMDNYDDYNDFHEGEDEAYSDDYDDSMDGDHESGLASCGWGTDESYGYYGDDREDFYADEAIGYVDYNEDGPYDD